MQSQSAITGIRSVVIAALASLGFATTTYGQDSNAWWPSANPTQTAVAPATATSPTPPPAAAPVAQSPAVQSPAPQAAATAAPEAEKAGWMVTSPLGNIGWPELKMPKVHWKPMWGRSETATAEPAGAGPMTTMRNMTQSVAQRTRSAWNSTVEKFKFTGSEPSRSPAPSQPGFFARMFGAGEQPNSPQTVPEFLAQERPGMTGR